MRNDRVARFLFDPSRTGTVQCAIYDVVGNPLWNYTADLGRETVLEWDLTNRSGIAVSRGSYVARFLWIEENGTQQLHHITFGVKE